MKDVDIGLAIEHYMRIDRKPTRHPPEGSLGSFSIPKEELEDLLKEMSPKSAAAYLDISVTAVYRQMKIHGIPIPK